MRGSRSVGIWLVLAIAASLRLGWALSRPTDHATINALPDQREYLALATNLLHGHGLSFLDPRFADTVWAFRTPGYPLFVAACGANVRALRAAQALVDTSTVLGVYLLALNVMGAEDRGRRATLAALLIALNPFLVYFTGLILSETLFTALLVWGLVLLVRGQGGQSRRWGPTWLWLAGGAILALSILVRPSALGLPVVLGAGAAWVNRPRLGSYQDTDASHEVAARRPRWPLPVGLTMVLWTVLALLPWAARNARVMGHWIWLDTNSGFTLYDGYNPDATGGADQRFVGREPELQVLDEAGRSEYLKQAALAYARTHPGRAARLAMAKLSRVWSPVPLSDEFGRPAYRAIGLAYAVPFDLLVLWAVVAGHAPRSIKGLLLAPAIYLSMVHMLTVGSLRYRIPAEPPLAVLAATCIGARNTPEWRRAPRP